MKSVKLFLSICTMLLCIHATAQNIGINNTNPQAALDVQGDLRLRSAILTLPAGLNNDVDLTTTKSSVYMFAGGAIALGGCQITGFTGGVDGRIVTIFNNSTVAAIQLYDANFSVSPSAAANKILTGTGSNAIIYGNGSVTLRYDGAKQKWTIIASNYADGLALPATNTNLSSIQGDTSVIAGYTFSTGTSAILPPLNSLAGNTNIIAVGIDDGNSAVTALPFSFTFNGKPYTHFIATSNGFIKLLPNVNGIMTSGINTYVYNLNLNTDLPKLAPWWSDLAMFTPNGGVWMLTEGVAPNRVFNIEYICGIYSTALSNLRFRISIAESDKSIQFTYFQTVPDGNFTIGIKSENFQYSSVDPSTNIANSNTVYQNILASIPAGTYYKWLQTPSPLSIINISTPYAFNQFAGNLAASGDIKAGKNITADDQVIAGKNVIAGNNLIVNGKIENENLISATPNAPWSGPFYYYKDKENRVHLSGSVFRQPGANGTVFFTLPPAYRPISNSLFPVHSNGTNGYIYIFSTTGNMTFFGADGNAYLDGISFRAN
jgi:hypothetical protein